MNDNTTMRRISGIDAAVLIGAAALIIVLLAVGVFAQTAVFRYFGPLSRVVTPNGDGRNDLAIFCFDNPADSDVSGRVYTLLGSAVATMSLPRDPAAAGCPAGFKPQSMTWDGRGDGGVVRSGVYVYRLTAEQKTYSGTLIVVR